MSCFNFDSSSSHDRQQLRCSSGISLSQPNFIRQRFWRISLAWNTNGAANPSGSYSELMIDRMPLLVGGRLHSFFLAYRLKAIVDIEVILFGFNYLTIKISLVIFGSSLECKVSKAWGWRSTEKMDSHFILFRLFGEIFAGPSKKPEGVAVTRGNAYLMNHRHRLFPEPR